MDKGRLYSGLEISYPKPDDFTQEGHFLKICDNEFYLAEGEMYTLSLMSEPELLSYLNFNRPEIPTVMNEEKIGISAVKKTLARALREENWRKEEFKREFLGDDTSKKT
ncbi:MAG TPA: hypothetical protein VJ208_03470 [Candidatus Nanoarchaeia archaeon]|nr:hypothetical protein [Candidatus Nanoarchaeia archaeon]